MLLPGLYAAIGLMYRLTKEWFVGMGFYAVVLLQVQWQQVYLAFGPNGAAQAIEGADVLMDGFGMIAMVAMMPINYVAITRFEIF